MIEQFKQSFLLGKNFKAIKKFNHLFDLNKDEYKELSIIAFSSVNPNLYKKDNDDSMEKEVLKSLNSKAKRLHKLHNLAFSKLQNATSDEQRFTIANEIMTEIIPEIDDTYKQIKYYEDNKEFLDDIEASKHGTGGIHPVAKLMLKRSSLKVMLSKAKSKLKSCKKLEVIQRLESEILEREIEIKEIEQKVGLI